MSRPQELLFFSSQEVSFRLSDKKLKSYEEICPTFQQGGTPSYAYVQANYQFGENIQLK